MRRNLFCCPECKYFGGRLVDLWHDDSSCPGTPVDVMAQLQKLLADNHELRAMLREVVEHGQRIAALLEDQDE